MHYAHTQRITMLSTNKTIAKPAKENKETK